MGQVDDPGEIETCSTKVLCAWVCCHWNPYNVSHSNMTTVSPLKIWIGLDGYEQNLRGQLDNPGEVVV